MFLGQCFYWELEENWMRNCLATVGDHNPPAEKILKCTLKNHNLLFIIFYNFLLKHFESIPGIIKHIWL